MCIRDRVTTIYNTRGGFDTTCVEGKIGQYFWYETQFKFVNFGSCLIEEKKMNNISEDKKSKSIGLGLVVGIAFGAGIGTAKNASSKKTY